MPNLPWIRVYTETLHDPKIRRLPTVQKWIWIGLLLLAGDSQERGKIYLAEGIPLTTQDISDALSLAPEDESHIETSLKAFESLKMLTVGPDGTLVINNFEKRQYDYPSDHPAEVAKRVKRHRDKKRNESVTNCNENVKRECIERDTDTDTDTEGEGEPATCSESFQAWQECVSLTPSPLDYAHIRGTVEMVGHRYRLYGLECPPMLTPDKAVAKMIREIAGRNTVTLTPNYLRAAVLKQLDEDAKELDGKTH